MRACCVPGSKSLTRCLGMPPSGEIASPIHKNTPSALDVNDFKMPKRKSLSADYMRSYHSINRERSCAFASKIRPSHLMKGKDFEAHLLNTASVITEAEAGLRFMSDLPSVDHLFEWPCRR